MDGLTGLVDGFAVAAQPQYLLLALIGVTLGTAIGVLPGIGPVMTIALLLPLTSTLDLQGSLIMFAGIYYGAMYGGSTTAILLNTPGEAASIVTALEGNRMARAGRGAAALATAAIGSFIAGTIGTVLLAVFAPRVAELAVRLGAPDYLALIVTAFVLVSTILGRSLVRGIVSLAIGLTLSLIGIDAVTGQSRLTFGVPELDAGIDVVLAAIGLFAVGEALHAAGQARREGQLDARFDGRRGGGMPRVTTVGGSWWRRSILSGNDLARSWRPWLRGTALGFPLGTAPAGGPTLPTFLSYGLERRLSRHPQEFGHGAIEGVAGPEAANNAAAAGTLVPLLTLGLPTSATAAVLLTAFQQYGIQPGPQLFDAQPDVVWSLIASLLIGNLMLLVLNLPLVGLWTRLLEVPRPYLYAGILMFSMLGAYAAAGTTTELVLLVALGLLGLVMRRFGLPVAPAVIGLILGPLAEQELRRALSISNGDATTLVSSPVAVTLYAITTVAVLAPAVHNLARRTGSERRADRQLASTTPPPRNEGSDGHDTST
ncbi:MAG: tripartite tricarboxylate transporter permease [Dermatophilaceae bacterium]